MNLSSAQEEHFVQGGTDSGTVNDTLLIFPARSWVLKVQLHFCAATGNLCLLNGKPCGNI